MNFKVVLLGEGCVGKTSIVLQYTQHKFVDTHEVTIQASFKRKQVPVGNQRVNLAIWDTAGQERFHALGPIYYRDADGALLVYDVTDRDSFLKVQMWVKELKKMLGKQICLAIAGNKVDMPNKNVSKEEAESYASTVGAVHFYTSAKLNQGIDVLFQDLAKRMLQAKQAKGPSGSSSSLNAPRMGRRDDLIEIGSDKDTPVVQQNNSGCGC